MLFFWFYWISKKKKNNVSSNEKEIFIQILKILVTTKLVDMFCFNFNMQRCTYTHAQKRFPLIFCHISFHLHNNKSLWVRSTMALQSFNFLFISFYAFEYKMNLFLKAVCVCCVCCYALILVSSKHLYTNYMHTEIERQSEREKEKYLIHLYY